MTANTTPRTFTEAQKAKFYDELHTGLGYLPLDANLNDKAIVAIGICIGNGINTMNHIVGTLARHGFKNGHVGSILSKSTGTDPDRHFWSRDENGRYQNLDKPSTMPRLA